MNYRLDPSVAENLKAWLSLRISYIEDKKQASQMEISIQQLNRAIIVCICVICWMIYKYIYQGVLNIAGPNATTYLLLSYVINILLPLVYSLNNAVNTVQLVECDCLSKLGLLQLNVEMLRQQHGSNKYDAFLAEIKSVKSIVERYVVPKYKFLWGLELSVTTKNSIITFLGTGFTLLTGYAVQSIKTESLNQVSEATGIDVSGDE